MDLKHEQFSEEMAAAHPKVVGWDAFRSNPSPGVNVPVNLLWVETKLSALRPQWRYGLVSGAHTMHIYQDSERIGSMQLERQPNRDYKFKITSHTLKKKARGDEARRTESVDAVVKIVLDNFRMRAPSEIRELYAATLSNGGYYSVMKADNAYHESITGKVSELLSIGDEYHRTSVLPVQKLEPIFKETGRLGEEAREAKRSKENMVAHLAFRRDSGWQIIDHNNLSTVYPEFDQIPEAVRGKLAVLTMLEDKEKYVSTVGMKVNNRVYWVLL